MDNKTLQERADTYHRTFGTWPAPKVDKEDSLRVDNRWIDGIWILGQDYRGSGYYGAYPPNYLRRIMALFSDAKHILHLFSGSLPAGNYIRFDRVGQPDVLGDANKLAEYFQPNTFDLILADPPYTEEDAAHYGTTLVNRNKVITACSLILMPGGFLVWLDQVLPMFRKIDFNLCGAIGIVRSTNHRFRVASIFRRI